MVCCSHCRFSGSAPLLEMAFFNLSEAHAYAMCHPGSHSLNQALMASSSPVLVQQSDHGFDPKISNCRRCSYRPCNRVGKCKFSVRSAPMSASSQSLGSALARPVFRCHAIHHRYSCNRHCLEFCNSNLAHADGLDVAETVAR